MPKYFAEKVCGHWLYFTTHCLLEAMHVHASRDSRLREMGAAKFFDNVPKLGMGTVVQMCFSSLDRPDLLACCIA